jgi:FtsZ-binding cell division protein ZapB
MFAELRSIRDDFESDLNDITIEIFNKIEDNKRLGIKTIPIDDVEFMLSELREKCVTLVHEEIDDLLYSEADALRPFLCPEK